MKKVIFPKMLIFKPLMCEIMKQMNLQLIYKYFPIFRGIISGLLLEQEGVHFSSQTDSIPTTYSSLSLGARALVFHWSRDRRKKLPLARVHGRPG